MIYIENIPPQLEESALRRLFERFGSVTRVILGKTSAKLRMRDREAALDAVLHLNGLRYGGRTLSVRSVRR